MNKILDFSNWTKISKNDSCGLYRYAIAPKVAYEIVIECHYIDTPIETAKATLYIVGLWRSGSTGVLEREKLAESLPIQELLEIANKDDEEHNKYNN